MALDAQIKELEGRLNEKRGRLATLRRFGAREAARRVKAEVDGLNEALRLLRIAADNEGNGKGVKRKR